MKRFYNLLFTSICFLLFSCSLFIDQKLIDKSSILKPKEGYTIVTFNIGQNESSLNSPRGVFVPQKLENFTNIDYTINIETSSGFFVTSATGSIDSIKTSFALQKGNKYNVEILGNISQEGQIKTVVKDSSQIDLTNTQEYLTVILNPKFFTDQSQKGNLSIEFDGLDAQYTYNYKIIYSNGDITTKGLISLENPKIQKNDISPGQHRLILTVNKTDVPSTIYFQKTFFVNVYSNVTTKNYFDESETLSEKVSLTEQMNENKPIFNENVVIYVAGQDATIASQEDSSIASTLGGTSLLRFNNLYQALQFVQSVGIADNVESPYPIYLDGTVQFNNAIGDATKYTSTNKLNILLSSVNADSVATIKTESRKQTTLEIKEFASVTLNNISLEGSNTPDSREHSILVNGTLIIKGKFYAEKLIYLPNDASTALIKLADDVSKLDSKENCGIIKRDSYPATGEGAQQVLQKLDSTQTSFATNLFSLESETHTINEQGQTPPTNV